MQRKATAMNERNTACYEVNLVLDLNQKVLTFLVFYPIVLSILHFFALEPLMMYFLY